MKALTVGDLRKAIADAPDSAEIVVRAWDDEGVELCVPLMGAEIEYAHDEDDTLYFALDAHEQDETEAPALKLVKGKKR